MVRQEVHQEDTYYEKKIRKNAGLDIRNANREKAVFMVGKYNSWCLIDQRPVIRDMRARKVFGRGGCAVVGQSRLYQDSSRKSTMNTICNAVMPLVSHITSGQWPVPPRTKFPKHGPRYGEAIYRTAHSPILRALSWKKNMSFKTPTETVCADVVNRPMMKRRASIVIRSRVRQVPRAKAKPMTVDQKNTGARAHPDASGTQKRPPSPLRRADG